MNDIEFEYERENNKEHGRYNKIIVYLKRKNDSALRIGSIYMSQEEFDRFCILMARGKVFEEFEDDFRDVIKEKLVGTGG